MADEYALLRGWLGQALEKDSIRDLAATVVTEKVHQHFDAQRLDDEMAALQEAPPWLAAMCMDSRWRALMYELLVANPRCALLQAAVRALSESEYAAEVQGNAPLCAAIGGASSMQTFVASLDAQLRALRQGQAGAQATLDGMACSGEAEFFSSQLLLRGKPLLDHASAGLVEHACGGMAEAAAAMHGKAARRLQLLAAGVPRQSALMNALVTILAEGGVSAGDAQKLREQSERGNDLAALREPAVLRQLLQALFDPSRPPKPEPRENLLQVLAYVGAGRPTAAQTGQAAPAAAASADVGEASSRYEAVLGALREAQSVCERNEVSEVATSVATLQRCAEEQVAACGILLWMRAILTSPQHSGARFNVSFLPPLIKLASGIAQRHAALQGEVCSLLHACLMHEPPADSDSNALTTVSLRRQLLDALLLLLARGCLLPVLGRLEAWLAKADLSLVRHLMLQLLALAAPPYSEAFARHVLKMIRHARTLEAHRTNADSRRPLIAFAQEAAKLPTLADEAQEVLVALKAGA